MNNKLLPFALTFAVTWVISPSICRVHGEDADHITVNNEAANYRSRHSTSTLAEDLAIAQSENNTFSDTDNNMVGSVCLETAIPEFTMTIPSNTVLPINTQRMRIGNVKINGRNFIKPDKIKVVITKQNFRNIVSYDEDNPEDHNDNKNKVIPLKVSDKEYSSINIAGTVGDEIDVGAPRYFFQDGKHTGENDDWDSMQTEEPYAYTTYKSENYKEGRISEINETHQVWLLTEKDDWKNKIPGIYKAKIVFNASVVSDEPEGIYEPGNLYPGEGEETDPNA